MSKYEEPIPWDDGEYGTGRTQPPKSHSGVIAILLIAVILLTGILTLLGFLNIRMFQQLQQQEIEENVTICFDPNQIGEASVPTVSNGLV